MALCFRTMPRTNCNLTPRSNSPATSSPFLRLANGNFHGVGVDGHASRRHNTPPVPAIDLLSGASKPNHVLSNDIPSLLADVPAGSFVAQALNPQQALISDQPINRTDLPPDYTKDEIPPTTGLLSPSIARGANLAPDEQHGASTTIQKNAIYAPNVLGYPVNLRRYMPFPTKLWETYEPNYEKYLAKSMSALDLAQHPSRELLKRRRSEPDDPSFVNMEELHRGDRKKSAHQFVLDRNVNVGEVLTKEEENPFDHISLDCNEGFTEQEAKAEGGKAHGDNSAAANRTESDRLLLYLRRKGLRYKEIKERGGFDEAESTLRGRFRALTKPPDARVRKPQWQDGDVDLLRKAVTHFAEEYGEDNFSAVRRDRLPWKKVAEWMTNNGASYGFAPGTCAKKWSDEGEPIG